MSNVCPLNKSEKTRIEKFVKEHWGLHPEFGALSDGAAPCDWQDPGILGESTITEEEQEQMWALGDNITCGVVVWNGNHSEGVGLLKHGSPMGDPQPNTIQFMLGGPDGNDLFFSTLEDALQDMKTQIEKMGSVMKYR